MNPASRLRHAVLAAALAAALPALAGNLNFLSDSPYANFTEKDEQIFRETLNDVLDKGADGESRKWTNPATRAGGEMKPVSTFERDSKPCRKLQIRNSARGVTATGTYTFCKDAAGKWEPTPKPGSPRPAP
jgi:surface antigen